MHGEGYHSSRSWASGDDRIAEAVFRHRPFTCRWSDSLDAAPARRFRSLRCR